MVRSKTDPEPEIEISRGEKERENQKQRIECVYVCACVYIQKRRVEEDYFSNSTPDRPGEKQTQIALIPETSNKDIVWQIEKKISRAFQSRGIKRLR